MLVKIVQEIFMKKACFFLFFVTVLVSCEITYYPVPFTNSSKKTVSFSYDGSTHELPTTERKVFSVKAYTQPPVLLGVPAGVRSVSMETDGDGYKFVDVAPIALDVLNTLSVKITIRADDYIEDDNSDGDSNTMMLTVEKNSTSTGTVSIYTSKPNFTVNAGGFPAQTAYTITDSNMYVTVR
jgi:hypothetical protein